ncbi:hypothetical protein GCM10023329_53730 [Streptomyces sanyensis]|uniref:RHS repeat-associated core domain-containing protein n=1 Tax=Streptomyces sanyensis TaxID=568869 RepID=A0ABP9BHT8_9ACTN
MSGLAPPGRHTFLGTGVDDPTTGLTHIGAREYDASTGRFISAAPLIDLTDPLQMNGYTYANGNPVMMSDPDGLRPMATGGSARDEDRYDRKYGTVTVKKPGQKFMPVKSSVPVSTSSKKASSGGGGPVLACRCGTRPPLVKGMKTSGLGGIPSSRAIKTTAKPGWTPHEPSPDHRPKANPEDEGFWESVGDWFLDKGEKVIGAYMGDTNGICLSGSAGLGVGYARTGCFVRTIREDGKSDYGVTWSASKEAPSIGFSLSGGLMGSNATSLEQLGGESWGGTVGGAWGPGAYLTHERAVDTINRYGEPVGNTSLFVGAGAGVELGLTSGETEELKLFTW